MCCWLEQQTFALLGRWVVETAEPEAKLVLLELSDHAAWRAQRWYELLPSAPPGADALVVGGDELDALLISADRLSGPDRTPAKLAVAEALLGMGDLLATVLAGGTSAVAGASVLRIVGIARADIAGDLDRCRSAMVASGAPVDGGSLQLLEQFRNRLDTVSALEFLAGS